MIGNDVVDLQLAAIGVNTTRPRWREKVFTDSEIDLIEAASDPFVLTWRLWSMKESAYKAHIRSISTIRQASHQGLEQIEVKRSLRPNQIKCTIISERFGRVSIDGQLYHTTTDTHSHILHSHASTDHSTDIHYNLIHLLATDRQTQHQELRTHFFKAYRGLVGRISPPIDIVKNELGVPILLTDGQESLFQFSFSYDGSHGAYAFQVM